MVDALSEAAIGLAQIMDSGIVILQVQPGPTQEVRQIGVNVAIAAVDHNAMEVAVLRMAQASLSLMDNSRPCDCDVCNSQRDRLERVIAILMTALEPAHG